MSDDNRELRPLFGAANPDAPVDYAFLAVQTFDDAALACEVLDLFVRQAGRVVPRLPDLPEREQDDAAHLLKGSARGIGAWPAAKAAEAYEAAAPAERPGAYVALAAAFAAATTAIAVHLSAHRSPRD